MCRLDEREGDGGGSPWARSSQRGTRRPYGADGQYYTYNILFTTVIYECSIFLFLHKHKLPLHKYYQKTRSPSPNFCIFIFHENWIPP